MIDSYQERQDALSMDPLEFDRKLRDELWGQLCCAWEELAEQHADMDEADDRRVLRAIKSIHFNEDHVVVIGKDNHISHFKFKLERVV
jgi:hypothetical protein